MWAERIPSIRDLAPKRSQWWFDEAKAAQDTLVAESPATCEHRADILWLAHRLRISEHRVADLRRQKRHLERRLRKALRGKRKH